MANIQQSVNSILSSAQGGAFLFAQTPLYKEKAALTQEKKVGERLRKEDEVLNKIIEDPSETSTGVKLSPVGESDNLISAYERSKELDAELYAHNISMYRQTGDPKYHAAALQYTPSRRKDYDDLIAEERKSLAGARKQAAATQQAQAAYSQRVITAQNMINTVDELKEYLSAKDRGHLTSTIHKLAKKGVIEYGNK